MVKENILINTNNHCQDVISNLIVSKPPGTPSLETDTDFKNVVTATNTKG